MKTATTVFRLNLKAKEIKEDNVLASKEAFANVICKFYAEARKCF